MHDITQQLIETTIGMKRVQIREIEKLESSAPEERADAASRIAKLEHEISQLSHDLPRTGVPCGRPSCPSSRISNQTSDINPERTPS